MKMNPPVLDGDLPPATLLLGPQIETLVYDALRAVRIRHAVTPADVFLRRHISAADARGIVKFAQTAPFGPVKVVIAELDGTTAQAQNILLKILEEPPEQVRFILVATARPLPTIVSRCRVIIMPAAALAEEPDAKVTGQVTTALNAALAGDLTALDRAMAGWGDMHHAVLSLLLAEAAAGRDMQDRVTPAQARRLLGALGRYIGAQPRLAAHAALVTVLSDRE